MIEKLKPAKLFEGEEEEWQTLDLREAFKVTEALAEPLRQWIYLELEKGPLRQADLAKRASEFFKKRVTNVLMRYHLQQLEGVGLVRSEIESSGRRRAKIISRSADLRIQLKQHLGPGIPPGEDIEQELAELFKSRVRRG
jgi:DNA-binding PadR family transcriptional regulator